MHLSGPEVSTPNASRAWQARGGGKALRWLPTGPRGSTPPTRHLAAQEIHKHSVSGIAPLPHQARSLACVDTSAAATAPGNLRMSSSYSSGRKTAEASFINEKKNLTPVFQKFKPVSTLSKRLPRMRQDEKMKPHPRPLTLSY